MRKSTKFAILTFFATDITYLYIKLIETVFFFDGGEIALWNNPEMVQATFYASKFVCSMIAVWMLYKESKRS